VVAIVVTPAGLQAEIEVTRPEGFELDVDITVPSGATLALLGPNGAGKTSVVAAIAGLLPLDAGRVVVEGSVLDDPAAGIFVAPEDRRVGVVFQDYLLFPHLSVIENVAFGLRRWVGRGEALSGAGEWMARLGLDGLADRRPATLSGGQAQRVALARALAGRPDVLLLDEPLAALDVVERARQRRTLAGHLDTFSGPKVLITHDPVEAFLLADDIQIIEHGSTTQRGDADEIRLRPRSQYAADLAGVNLVTGTAAGGEVAVGSHTIHVADHQIEGEVLLTIQPAAVSVHRARPSGSQRNSWITRVDRLEQLGERARLRTSEPLPLTVEITREATQDLGLQVGSEIWVALKATEIGVVPDEGRTGR
jgi:molybdate transport system ATP-binding protein